MSDAFNVGSKLLNRTITSVNLEYNHLVLTLDNGEKVEIEGLSCSSMSVLSIQIKDKTGETTATYIGDER